jgi:hypothetical protein
MAADDATEKDAPSTNDEPEDKEDVEGNWAKIGGLTPDPEVLTPKATHDGKPDPVEGVKCP